MEHFKYYLECAYNARLNQSELDKVYDSIFKATAYKNKDSDTEFFTLNQGLLSVISFRGTEPKECKDWATDINALSIPYGNTKTKIRVHRGFLNAYQSVRGTIHEYYKHNCQSKALSIPVVVTGHSLGGALAVLCAVDLQYNFNIIPSAIRCIPFGAPKVFNREGVESYNRRVPFTNRVNNRYDLVPIMPPLPVYKHVGIETRIGPDNIFSGIVKGIKTKGFDGFGCWVNHDLVNCYFPYVK